MFANENQCADFLQILNSTHPSIQFTFEKEFENKLLFLDVLTKNIHENSSPQYNENQLSPVNIFDGILSFQQSEN